MKSTLHEAMGEVPALVGAGFLSLHKGRYLLACVSDPVLARAWLREVLAAGLVKALADVRLPEGPELPEAASPARDRHGEVVTIAISHAGLQALGLQDDPERPFPSAFRAGMGHPVRRRLLGEDPIPGRSDDSFEPWDWSDQSYGTTLPVHVLVAHYWGGDSPSSLLDPSAVATGGFRLVRTVQADERAIKPGLDKEERLYEPFGFQDGVGQPLLRGLKYRDAPSARAYRMPLQPDAGRVQPGEFVLGHPNEYHETSYSPSVLGWPGGTGAPRHFAAHGSYLAVRQIRQHVDTFREYTKNSSVERLASKMMGRRMSGWPLVTGPHAPANPDDFLYLASDEPGFECPRGAHVRRANVRDALAHDEAEGIRSSSLHRLLRRGRVYVDNPQAAKTGDGIMFIALNADLDRQFEFVHRNWIMGSRFGDLYDEQDPILGTRRGRMYTVPGLPVGQRVGPLPPFTTVLGGGYFFLPGMSALRFIASNK
ncbi:MAG: hypothetical protein RL722_1721 [Pseudomonadota bacterium]|jgi:putative iron-dependent peroxidase